MRSPITTHVLDLATGRPGEGIGVFLRRRAGGGGAHAGGGASRGGDAGDGGDWREIGRGITNSDGRVEDLLPAATRIEPGTYSLTFRPGPGSRPSSPSGEISSSYSFSFFPEVTITFVVTDPAAHYHIPLLLSPFGYSTYRGS